MAVVHGEEGRLLALGRLVAKSKDVRVRVFHRCEWSRSASCGRAGGGCTVCSTARVGSRQWPSLTGRAVVDSAGLDGRTQPPALHLTDSPCEPARHGRVSRRSFRHGRSAAHRSSSPFAECLSITGSERVCPILRLGRARGASRLADRLGKRAARTGETGSRWGEGRGAGNEGCALERVQGRYEVGGVDACKGRLAFC